MANDIRELGEALLDAYNNFKNEVRQINKLEYERWEAGGYLVDSDIMSHYPNVEELIEKLSPDEICPCCGESLEDDVCQNPDCDLFARE